MEGMVNHWLATPICYDIDAVLGNPESHLCSSLSTSVNSDFFLQNISSSHLAYLDDVSVKWETSGKSEEKFLQILLGTIWAGVF